MKKLHLILLLVSVAMSSLAQTVGEAFYIYRNDGEFNAFFRDEVDSIAYSNYDADSVYYDDVITQLIYTQDSLYRIPLEAIDSVAFKVNDIVISPDYLPMDENEYTIKDADIEKGEYNLAFSKAIPNVKIGNVLTIHGDTLTQIVRVVKKSVLGKELRLSTVPADLGDIFNRGTFTLSTETNSASARNLETEDDCVFYPDEVVFFDDNNQKRIVRKSMKRDLEFTKRLYNYTIDYSGHEFFSNKYAKLYLESCRLDINLDLVVKCNFNTVKEAANKYRKGELAIQKAVVRGSAESDFMLRFDAQGSKSEDFPEEVLKSNIHKPIVAKFIVAGVPVFVVMNTHLLGCGNYDCSGSFSAYAGFATSTTVEQGLSWSQASGIKHYSSFDSSFEMHKPTIEGEAHLKEKISIFPRITFSIYGLYGPSFDIKPYLRATQDLSFFDELGTNKKDYYGAKVNLYAGYDAAVGLSYMSYMGNKPFLKSPSWNVAEKYLYEGPYALYLANDSSEALSTGVPVSVSFYVADYDHLFDRPINAQFPFMVKFETNSGTLSSDFAMVDLITSLASVKWTPSIPTTDGKTPYILALMHDSNGNVIAANRWKPNIKVSTLPPVATTGDCSKVTKTSATVLCTFDNVPKDGICGVEYTWADGSFSKTIGNANGKQEITLSGLEPGTTYTYCAFIEANGQTYYGEEKTFTTEAVIPDIVGEWNCTEYNEDGSQIGKPYKITLYEDHTAKSELWTYNDSGKWSVNSNGKEVVIQFTWDNPYRYAYQWVTYDGTINDLFSPSRIEGTKNVQTQVPPPSNSHFIMTR